jgi:integrase/recombinase XerD
MLEFCFMEEKAQNVTRSAYSADGCRKYLTRQEGVRFLKAVRKLASRERLFCETVYFTGCRISEALALTSGEIDLAQSTVILRTLKKRDRSETRRVPIPSALARRLKSLGGDSQTRRLWTYSRSTGWRIVKEGMTEAKISGLQATTKGLRHAFGVRAAMARVPFSIIQRWMGHSDSSTTSIYLDVQDVEERSLIRRTW